MKRCVALVFLLLGSVATARLSPATTTCRELMIPVSVASGLPATESVYAELCLPSEPTSTIQLMVTPSAANHRLWDPSYQPERYSIIRAYHEAGYATLNIDPVGSGNSSHPLSALVTVDAYAYELHQIVQKLRAGALGGFSFDRVIANGLSNGALTSVVEAGEYADVDGLIITGFPNPDPVTLMVESAKSFEPAAAQHRYDDRHLDPGYLAANDYFYDLVMVSPNGYDRTEPFFVKEARDTLTASYAVSIGIHIARFADPGGPLSPSHDISVPVLVGMGGEDLLFCGHALGNDCTDSAALRRSVAPFFPKAPLDAFVLPGAGHIMHLALNAPDWFAYAIAWSDEVVG